PETMDPWKRRRIRSWSNGRTPWNNRHRPRRPTCRRFTRAESGTTGSSPVQPGSALSGSFTLAEHRPSFEGRVPIAIRGVRFRGYRARRVPGRLACRHRAVRQVEWGTDPGSVSAAVGRRLLRRVADPRCKRHLEPDVRALPRHRVARLP